MRNMASIVCQIVTTDLTPEKKLETSMRIFKTPLNTARAAFISRAKGWNLLAPTTAMVAVVTLSGCAAGLTSQTVQMACDDGIKAAFKPDANTQVLFVKQFKNGDSIALSNTPATPAPSKATADICLVKLLVGPGNPGPAGAPSTSAGIGIEVWLPTAANWNERIRAFGSGGWAGGTHSDTSRLGGGTNHTGAAAKGYVAVTSDHGHAGVAPFSVSASFAMNPDGTINTTLWKDFAERSMHEMADKSKALTKLFYGKPQKYAYWDGFSTGGRQGMKLAQVYPNDFDGILAGAPAFNWSRFITNELYPQVAMQRDLGAPISNTKISAVTAASVASCGGGTLGFLLNPYACKYDPTKHAAALCSGVAGNGGVVGTNADTATCMSLAEATVMNKIWYGQTTDGSVPDPATDNASGPNLTGNKQLWFGLTRGTNLGGLAGASGPFPIAADQVALELQTPSFGSQFFTNAISNGANNWRTMSYADLVFAAHQGLALQSQFSNINTDNPDLSAFNSRKGKLLMYHGLADNLIAPQGSDNYYQRVMAAMGGLSNTQQFFKYYQIPGFGHDGGFAATAALPLPQNVLGRDELFQALQAWVETGTSPGTFDVSSANASVSLPLCVYPQKLSYGGSGSQTVAASYSCK
jgi:hypothetical protein